VIGRKPRAQKIYKKRLSLLFNILNYIKNSVTRSGELPSESHAHNLYWLYRLLNSIDIYRLSHHSYSVYEGLRRFILFLVLLILERI
jgi:hypothetical protein